MHSFLFLTTLLATTGIQAVPIQKRAVVNLDTLNPLPEAVQSGTLGELLLKYEPRLYISHGCQSYPAVDEAGNVRYGPNLSMGISFNFYPYNITSYSSKDTKS